MPEISVVKFNKILKECTSFCNSAREDLKYVLKNGNGTYMGGNFSISTVQSLISYDEELKEKLLRVYENICPLGDDVCESIKILQAITSTEIVVGFNMVDWSMSLYTANDILLKALGYDKYTDKKTVSLNRDCIIHSARIDIELKNNYTYSYKIVNPTSKTHLYVYDEESGSDGDYYIIPMGAFLVAFDFLDDCLRSNVVKVTQDIGEVMKTRFVTSMTDVLCKYSDNESFSKSLKTSIFYTKGYMYAPVIGADSTTLGLTRLNLIDINNIEIVKPSEYDSLPISRGTSSAISDSVISTILTDMYNTDIGKYTALLENIPELSNSETGAIEDVSTGVIGVTSLMKHIRGLSEEDRCKVEKLLPEFNKLQDYRNSLFNGYERIDVSGLDVDKLKAMLKEGAYKITILRKTGGYSSLTVTNNVELLKGLYGDDYFRVYESKGVRWNTFVNCCSRESSLSLDLVEKYKELCGVDVDSSDFIRHISEGNKATDYRKSTSRSSTTSSILVRKCFADDPSDFYRYIDLSKVVSVIKLK